MAACLLLAPEFLPDLIADDLEVSCKQAIGEDGRWYVTGVPFVTGGGERIPPGQSFFRKRKEERQRNCIRSPGDIALAEGDQSVARSTVRGGAGAV
jgi:hypothetical protein